jgi:uncharacterized membrane protein YkvA (DUF1232 family)
MKKPKRKAKPAAKKPIAKKHTAKRPKAKKPPPPRPRYEQAAVRSEAFAKAILEAKSYTADPDSLRTLFEQASLKAARIPRTTLKDAWPYLQAMLRLIWAYSLGDYREISKDALLTIVAALSYLIDPFDLIPDEIPFLGLVDDATVIVFAVSRTRPALDAFMTWETSLQ